VIIRVPGTCHTAFFLRLFVPNSLTVPHPFGGVFRIPVYIFLRGDLRSTATSAPSLKPPRPERLPNMVPLSPDSRHPRRFFFQILCFSYSSLSLSLTQIHTSGDDNSLSGRCSPISGSSYSVTFLRFGGGRPLHSVP
jgi:hypothetical protein